MISLNNPVMVSNSLEAEVYRRNDRNGVHHIKQSLGDLDAISSQGNNNHGCPNAGADIMWKVGKMITRAVGEPSPSR